MPSLLDPLALRALTVPNRIWTAPMCQYSCSERDGMPGPWHLAHLGQFAIGRFGLVMTEATAVSPEGRISDRDTGIWSDAQAEAWRPIAGFLASQGSVPAMQLAHAGRKASTYAPFGTDGASGTIPAAEGGWRAVAPSAIPFEGYAEPDALDADGIRRVVDDFAAAARRAVGAGFAAVEVHAAHGYLLHEFLSPLSNTRDDEWGGSLENRARLVVEVVAAVRAAVGDAPVLVRFSATDWSEGGVTPEDVGRVAAWCRDAGADFFDVSSGGLVPAEIPVAPGYQVPLATTVRTAGGVAANAVGLITEPAQAERIVASGEADAVMLGREALRDPRFPLRAAREAGVELDGPPQYGRAL